MSARAAQTRVCVAALRKAVSPYHLAHGLLDQAQYQLTIGDRTAAGPTIEEARTIGNTLRCRPLIDRATTLASSVESTVH